MRRMMNRSAATAMYGSSGEKQEPTSMSFMEGR